MISKPRTGRERKPVPAPVPLQTGEAGSRRERPVDVWEARRKTLEKVAVYVGRKVL